MKRILISILILVVSTSFKTVGSGTAYLNCKSESGRTIFKAEIQDIDSRLEKAELTIDGSKITFNEDEVNANIVFDSKNGVYTIAIENKPTTDFAKHKFLKFWAIPKTFKTIIENSSESKYEFKAKVYATEPRSNKERISPEIELNCTLEYRI